MTEIVLHFCNATDLIKAYTIALNKLSATWSFGYISPSTHFMIIDLESYHISYARIYTGKGSIIEVK